MGINTQVEKLNRHAIETRPTTPSGRPASPWRGSLSYLAPRPRRTAVPARRSVEHIAVAPTPPAVATGPSALARFRGWLAPLPGRQNTPSDIVLETIAHTAYDRFR